MCSQPAAEMWPRNEFGNERRWSSPSPSAVASIPAPDWTVVCSIDGALARGEERSPAEQVDPALAERQPVDRLHPPGRLHQHRDLLLERDVERVHLHRRVPGAGHGFDRGEDDGFHRQAGGRLRDLDRELGGALDLLGLLAGGGGEPPVPVHQHPDPQALGGRAVDPLHLLVPDGDRLGVVGHDATVGIVGSGGSGRLDGLFRDVEHPIGPPGKGTTAAGTAYPACRRSRSEIRARSGKMRRAVPAVEATGPGRGGDG